VDHRLVREGKISACSHPAAALYLFLITVADARGLSYYSDASLQKRLCMDPDTLCRARNQLIGNDLVAFKAPIYQVLPLDPPAPAPKQRTSDGPQALGHIFKTIMERAND
jgi:hypothetical protein